MYDLYAQFPRQQICKDRQYSGLLRWSSAKLAEAIPETKPPESFVEQRIVAGKIPLNVDLYVQQTIAYTLKNTTVQVHIRIHLSAFNEEALEQSLDGQIDLALTEGMPLYCHAVAMATEIDMWYADNGFEEVASPPVFR